MVFRNLFNYFANNPQVIDKLAESYPMRRAAQLTVYAYSKGKTLSREILQESLQNGTKKVGSFSQTFQREVKEGWKEATSAHQKKN